MALQFLKVHVFQQPAQNGERSSNPSVYHLFGSDSCKIEYDREFCQKNRIQILFLVLIGLFGEYDANTTPNNDATRNELPLASTYPS